MSRNRGPIDSLGSTYKTVSCIGAMQVQPATDVIYPEVLLYIEGVQVPFTAISISSTYTGMPQASIEVPYFPGLQEMLKGYFPKVHVFFKDNQLEKYTNYSSKDPLEEKELRRLLFSGILIGVQYSKRKSTNDASASITFRCVHKYYPLTDILFKFGSRGAEQVVEQDVGAVAGLVSMNSPQVMQAVIGGITKPTSGDTPVSVDTASNCSLNHLTPELRPYYERLQGIPGIAMAIWNMVKRDTFLFKENARTMTDIYIPLVDKGLRPFERMSGHKVIEKLVDEKDGRKKPDESELAKQWKGYAVSSSDSLGTADMIVPPGFKNFIGDAAATDIALTVIQTGMQYMGEMSNVWAFIAQMMRSLDYDVEVLASPIQRTDGPAVDLLVKPLLPFFYSPVCNVLLPNMWNEVTINDDSVSVPTRVLTKGTLNKALGSSLRELEYRGPFEVREAISSFSPDSNGTLGDTTMFIGEFPAIHEFGRGVKTKLIDTQRWASLLGASEVSRAPTARSVGGNVRQIITSKEDPTGTVYSLLEDPSDKTRVWEHWPEDKKRRIPKYTLDPSAEATKGYDMEYGKPGSPTSAVQTKITDFRKNTNVPKHWNVIYSPEEDAFSVFPPHYDPIRDEWWMTNAMWNATEKRVGVLNIKNKEVPANKNEQEAQSESSDYRPTGQDKKENTTPAGDKKEASLSTDQQKLLQSLRETWNKEHPNNERLNPYETYAVNGSTAYEITLFALVDYQAGLSLVETRTATLSGGFNPYIIPGYPMDVVDASTDAPSLHGFCTSVTHSITASSIGTSYSMSSVMTYDELRRYNLPSILPWFREQFKMWTKLSLMGQSEEVLSIANQYYLDALGVGVADPTILEDAETGAANSLVVKNDGRLGLDSKDVFESMKDLPGGAFLGDSLNPNLTLEGNLFLVRREIETQADIEQFSGTRFVDIANRSSLSQQELLKDCVLAEKQTPADPGFSVFLTYGKERGALDKAKARFATPKETKSQTQIKERK